MADLGKIFLMRSISYTDNNNNNNNSCIYNAHISIQRGCSRHNILLLPRLLDTISRPHLYSAQFLLLREHSLPSCLSRRSGKYIHNISFTCILPGTHLYTWVESSNVGKVSDTGWPIKKTERHTPIIHVLWESMPFRFFMGHPVFIHQSTSWLNRVPKCDVINFFCVYFSIFMTIFQ